MGWNPNWTYGQVPTPAQWNDAFARKQDELNYTPLNQAGGSMTGPLHTTASTVDAAGFSINPGVAPAVPNDGDIWMTSAGIYYQALGVTYGPLGDGTISGPGTTTDRAIAIWNGTDGSALQNSAVVIDSDSNLTITSTLAGAGAGPIVTLTRDKAASVSDVIGEILVRGRNSSSSLVSYGAEAWVITDPTAASEDADRQFYTMVAGVLTLRGSITATGWNGMDIGATTAGSGRFTTLTITGAGTLSPANANVSLQPTGTGQVIIGPATAGTIDKMNIGATTPGTGAFTTLSATGAASLNPANANVSLQPTGTGVVTINPGTAGSIDRMNIGATTRGTGAFTTGAFSGTLTPAALVDISGASASQIKFGNANNSSDAATLDGYTDWVAYTPTITGFGTPTGVFAESKRVGDTLYIRGKFTSGTGTGVEARFTLGFNGTNANVNSDATKVPTIQIAGASAISASSATTFAVIILIESNVGYLTFGLQSSTAASLTKALGNAVVGTGNTISFNAEIPISGW